MSYVKITHKEDPKQKLLNELGDISGIHVANNNVLLAVYQRPTTMMLGGREFELTSKTVGEDRYQSKVGLIIKYGPTAFVKNDTWVFLGDEEKFELHDWVAMPVAVASSMLINGVLCRIVTDTVVKMKIPDCDMVY